MDWFKTFYMCSHMTLVINSYNCYWLKHNRSDTNIWRDSLLVRCRDLWGLLSKGNRGYPSDSIKYVYRAYSFLFMHILSYIEFVFILQYIYLGLIGKYDLGWPARLSELAKTTPFQKKKSKQKLQVVRPRSLMISSSWNRRQNQFYYDTSVGRWRQRGMEHFEELGQLGKICYESVVIYYWKYKVQNY